MIAAAALLIAVGSLGSWVGVPGAVDLRGIEGDGVLTLALALIVLLSVGLGRLRGRGAPRWTAAVCAVLVLAVAVYDLVDILGTDFGPLDGGPGWGLWLTLIGGVALLVVAARDWRRGAPGRP